MLYKHSFVVAVAQLVERLLPKLEDLGSNQSSAKIYINFEHLFTVNCVLKR